MLLALPVFDYDRLSGLPPPTASDHASSSDGRAALLRQSRKSVIDISGDIRPIDTSFSAARAVDARLGRLPRVEHNAISIGAIQHGPFSPAQGNPKEPFIVDDDDVPLQNYPIRPKNPSGRKTEDSESLWGNEQSRKRMEKESQMEKENKKTKYCARNSGSF